MATCYGEALKFDEAEKAFRSELANNPEHPLALAYLGDTEIRLNRSDEAVPYLEHAVRIQPSIAIAHVDLGVIYEGQGRKDDAVRELKTAEKLSPDDPSIHWRLGRFYQSMGRKAEAKAEFDKTRNMQRAKEQSLREQMHQVEAKPAAQNTDIETQVSVTTRESPDGVRPYEGGPRVLFPCIQRDIAR